MSKHEVTSALVPEFNEDGDFTDQYLQAREAEVTSALVLLLREVSEENLRYQWTKAHVNKDTDPTLIALLDAEVKRRGFE